MKNAVESINSRIDQMKESVNLLIDYLKIQSEEKKEMNEKEWTRPIGATKQHHKSKFGVTEVKERTEKDKGVESLLT